MAKKDFKKTLNETSNLEEVTRSYFSDETLKKAEQKQEEIKQEEQKEKRKYTKLKTSINRSVTVSCRLTQQDYDKLIKKAEQENYGTISKYLEKIIKEVL